MIFLGTAIFCLIFVVGAQADAMIKELRRIANALEKER